MTPRTRQGIWSSGRPIRPGVVVATDSRIDWEDAEPFGDDWPGTETLLDDFLALAVADPEDMAAFVMRYGLPELCVSHGRPMWHAEEAAIDHLSVLHIRRAARAFEALLTAGRRLKKANQATPSHDVANFLGVFFFAGYGRRELAEELTQLYRDCGIRPLVRWEPGRMLTVTTEGAGLMGFLAVLLLREIAMRDEVSYRCTVCGDFVERGRPPRPDEAIYCDRAECKREQRRRNTAAYRARKQD